MRVAGQAPTKAKTFLKPIWFLKPYRFNQKDCSEWWDRMTYEIQTFIFKK